MDIKELEQTAKDIRSDVVKMAHDAPSSHVGSALSCVDILTTLYFQVMKPEDRFIMSKGHGCMALYAALAKKGIINKELLATYSKNGSLLAEHPLAHDIPGIEFATGSLGHGLSLAAGAALARKIQKQPGKEYVLLSDGECNEGSTWEAAMIASKLNLTNLVAIIDYNKMQAAGFTDDQSLYNKWQAFGWKSIETPGNNVKFLLQSFEIYDAKQPTVIIAHTIKGKGVSFMENDLLWHYRAPDDKELEKALEEINA